MAVEMIGGPRFCEPLLATGLGRFTGAASRHAKGPRKRTSPHLRSGCRFQAHRNALRQTRSFSNYFLSPALCLVTLPPWHSGFNQLKVWTLVSGIALAKCEEGFRTWLDICDGLRQQSA